MKHTCLVVLILIVVSTLIPMNVGAWEEEDSWSFKQYTDYSKYTEQDFKKYTSPYNTSPDNDSSKITSKLYKFDASGKEAFLYTLKYIGEENDLHRFDYKGGFYTRFDSDVHFTRWFNSSFGGYFSNYTFEINGRLNIKEVDIEFNGTIWAEKYIYQNKSYGVEKAWSIVKQYIHSEVYEDVQLQWRDNDSNVINANVLIDSKIDLMIDYSPPMPWIPIFEEDINLPEFVSIDADYQGELSGTAKYKVTGEDINESSNSILDKDRNIELDEEFSDSEKLFNGLSQVRDKYTKSSPILRSKDVGAVLSRIFIKKEGFTISYFGFIENTLGCEHGYIFDNQTQFYSSFDQIDHNVAFHEPSADYSVMSPWYLNTIYDDKEVEQTSESEVNNFLKDKESYTMGKEAEANEKDDFVIILFITIVTALIFIWLLFSRDKGENVPTKFTELEKH